MKSPRVSRVIAILAVAMLSGGALAQSSERLRLEAAQKKKASGAAAEASAPPEAASTALDLRGALLVSNKELNTFSFGAPVKRVMFPSTANVAAPVYLPGNESFVIEFSQASEPLQMLVVMDDGTARNLRILPRPIPGVMHRLETRRGGGSAASQSPANAGAPQSPAVDPKHDPRAADLELLRRLAIGQVPSEFEPQALPPEVLFDKFRVVPMRVWSNGAGRRLMVFSLVATPGKVAVVSPPQFYRPGITAVMVDGDVVDQNSAPTLYVVEENFDE